MNRNDVLSDLVFFKKSVGDLATELRNFSYDTDEPLLTLSADHLISVINKFLNNEIQVQELEGWANLVEGREDLDFQESSSDAIQEVIYRLANPALEGKLTKSLGRELIEQLTVKRS